MARRIVALEAGGSLDPAASAAAVESACGRLNEQLVDLLGAGGVSAVLGRALHLATREQPLLAGVAVSGERAGCYTGLKESLAGSTDEEAMAAAANVLTHVLDLLVTLLGEDLGTKPIRKLWPRATRSGETEP